jgi:hypothetical protein
MDAESYCVLKNIGEALMRRNKFIGYGTFLLLSISVALGALQIHHSAVAGTYGRPMYQGYYDGKTYTYPDMERFVYFEGLPTSWGSPPNSTTVDIFIQGVSDYLNNTGPVPALVADHQAEYADARASILINTMMGIQATDPRYDLNPALPRWQNGIILAKQLYPAWVILVRAYDAGSIRGASVEWNGSVHSTPADINGAGIALCNTAPCDEGVDRGAIRQEIPDIYFVPADDEIKDAMIFHHPNGTTYTIKKWCGNLVGDESPFPQDWTHVPQLVAATPTGTVSAGAVLNFVSTANNSGTNISTGGTLTGNMTIDGAVQPIRAQAVFPALAAKATTAPLAFSYTIPAFSAAGTAYCFYTSVIPHSFSDPSSATSFSSCYIVGYNSSPSIQGINGDIHAGGGICGQPLSGGTVTGNASAASYGDYVVASAGLITNFKSNGSAGVDNLTLGANGNYSRACRPDLLQSATNGRAATSATITTATVDLGALTGAGKPDVYYFDGPVLSISGTASSKVTIVATVGSIHIVGPILLNNALVASRYVPSVGLIAQGDIVIDPIVTRVDAYIFSNSTIDTCLGAAPGVTFCSTPQLVINGFLMGKSIRFNRVGTLNSSGAQVSEKVILTPQIYLNPPKFFDVDITKDLLQAQGEKPPLF